uniref:Uncharacterized protein n=1 Tax=Romanomermis culicivorax TaxID=13658 RepID=A0A915HVD3_ROMCU
MNNFIGYFGDILARITKDKKTMQYVGMKEFTKPTIIRIAGGNNFNEISEILARPEQHNPRHVKLPVAQNHNRIVFVFTMGTKKILNDRLLGIHQRISSLQAIILEKKIL